MTGTLPMTRTERDDFKRLDRRVSECLNDALQVWQALTEIRDRRLYRDDYKTFEDYCQERHSLTNRRVNQLLGHAAMVEQVGTNGSRPPDNERQSRELAKAPAEQRGAILDAAREIGGGKATAALLAELVVKMNSNRLEPEELVEEMRAASVRVRGQAAAIEQDARSQRIEKLEGQLKSARRTAVGIDGAEAIAASLADDLARLKAL